MELAKPVKNSPMLILTKEPALLIHVISQPKFYWLMELATPVDNSPMLTRTREPVSQIPALKMSKFCWSLAFVKIAPSTFTPTRKASLVSKMSVTLH